jgi:hypothetical protein
MAVYFDARAAVGGDPAGLDATADLLGRFADDVDRLTNLLRDAAHATESAWTGAAAEACRISAANHVAAITPLPTHLDKAAGAFHALAAELTAAQTAAANAMAESERVGLASGDLVGRPFSVARFVLTHPDKAGHIAMLIGAVVRARWQADDARQAFITSLAPLRAQLFHLGEKHETNRRGSDERSGRRISRDDREGREPGGGGRSRGRGGDLDNDWAGRAILEHYLRGGGDWVIENDPNWTEYMSANDYLRRNLMEPVQVQAQSALDQFLRNGTSDGSFDQRFHMEIENGEGIVGYQYLHGTNTDTGDFQFRGDTAVRPLPDGKYEVTLNSEYTWNDRIDPNGIYATDRIKSGIAEVLTLGRADPYDIHITWPGQTKIIMDVNGNVYDVSGYPD